MPLVPADCDKRPGSRSCSAWYIAGRLGHRRRSPQWIFKQIQLLIEHEGFPPPIVQFTRFGHKVDGLHPSSRWQLEPVDAWFDGQPSAQLPDHILANAGELTERRQADELDARAGAFAGASA